MADSLAIESVGEYASAEAMQWASHHTVGAAVALVASNVPLLASVAYCAAYRLYPEAAAALVTFTASSMYHLCQTTDVCLFSLYTHVISDHIFVFTLISWMFLFLLRVRVDVQAALFVLTLPLIVPLMIQYMEAWWVMPLIAALFTVAYIVDWVLVRRAWPHYDWYDLGGGAVLLAVGVVFYFLAGPPGSERYVWAHSLWHFLIMLGLYFALESTDGEPLGAKIRRRYRRMTRRHAANGAADNRGKSAPAAKNGATARGGAPSAAVVDATAALFAARQRLMPDTSRRRPAAPQDDWV